MADVSTDREAGEETVRRSGALLRLLLLAALVGGGIAAATLTPLGDHLSRDGIGRAIEWLRGSTWAPVVFVAVYASATALAIPGTILTLAGGALFGVVQGTVYNTLAANLGANMAFAVSRFLGRDGVRELVGDRLDALDRAARNHGFRGLLTLRLIPVVPFNALNFGMGLTAISWGAYALATLVGIFPGTVVYTMFADALLAGSQEASREALVRVLISGALLLALSFLPALARRLGVSLPGREGDDSVKTSGVLILLAAGAVAPPAGLSAQEAPLPSHEPFTALLEEVVEVPRVDYALLRERRSALDGYLSSLGEVGPASLERAPREDRLAFWINAYNACMLKLVVDHYPLDDADAGLLTRVKNLVADRPENSVWRIEDVFTRDHCRIAGEERSQDEIEHEIIRPRFQDPRIHFVVNCAARSCPPLRRRAFRGGTLDRRLDEAVEAFVTDPRHFEVVREDDGDATVRLNKVLDWYRDDFGGLEGLRAFFQPYVDADTATLLRDPATGIEFFDYDWTLNDTGS